MNDILDQLLSDLVAETAVLDDVLITLIDEEWEIATPAEGWAVRDQVSHLAFFDEMAVLAVTHPARFRDKAKRLWDLGPNFPDVVAATYRSMNASDLGAWFRSARADLLLTFGGLEGKERVPWFGPEMSVTSSATARLMETWAHAQDLFDAFALERPATDRIKHIAHLGVRTMGFSFALNERPVPDVPVRVELEAPSGVLWTWGADNARDSVTGTALDFCLVVTQRRNLADTSLTVDGAVAGEWMSIAQAFAGAPGPGRAPAEAARRVS